MKLEMIPAQVDAIVVKELNRMLEGFEEDLKDRQEGSIDHAGYFDNDYEKDIAALQKHIECCKVLLNYYR